MMMYNLDPSMNWITRILLVLLLGIVTTVGVAWGLGYSVNPFTVKAKPKQSRPIMARGLQFIAGWHECAGTRMFYWVPIEHASNVSEADPAPPSWQYPTTDLNTYTIGRGWPLLCLCQGSIYEGNNRWATTDAVRVGVFQESLTRTPRLLPLRPIFPGFIINAVFYAAIWFGIFFGVAALRRALRRKRGRCVKCSYDLRGQLDGGCPECGWNRGEPAATTRRCG